MKQRSRPLYQEIADELLTEIRSGKVPVGTMMPTEMELRERFGVSRHTIREAMRQLGDMGLLTRQAGLGTIVIATEVRGTYTQSIGTLDELLRYPPETTLQVSSSDAVKADSALAATLGCKKGEDWIRISGLRSLDGGKRPICWTDVYVIPEYARLADEIGKEPMPVYRLVEKLFGENVTEVKLDLFADGVPDAVADALKVAPGTPALVVVRRYTGHKKRVFEVSVSIHPQDRFTYSAELRREW
ncbi:MAG: GntR family transcriptional regulator [Alphaproteobacteria bacterium]|nr:GntR family transcriptional regulator [Alphaproteobacteria bacterium]